MTEPSTDRIGGDEPSPTCGHPFNATDANPIRCTDVPHHYGVHDNGRNWWHNNTYPTGSGPCTTAHCTLYNGHPGPHHTKDTP